MAKEVYKIPTTLDASYFDMEFNLKSKDGVGLSQPVSAKVIVTSLFLVFLWFYLVFQTFISKGGVPSIVGFTISFLVLSVVLVKSDKTGRMGVELLISMINYIPKSSRFTPTRLSDSIYPLKNLLNIDDVAKEDGSIQFLDGQVGFIYHVVGSASSLMFKGDKQEILDKVDSFYRKLPVGVEIIYDTIYEGHAVEEQIGAVKEINSNLKVKSKGLNKLIKEQHDVLKYVINNNQGLTSLHQYLIVRSPNAPDLATFENLLRGDVENQGLMFRLVKTLNYEEVENYLKSIIKGN